MQACCLAVTAPHGPVDVRLAWFDWPAFLAGGQTTEADVR
jgi:hypothetical protein